MRWPNDIGVATLVQWVAARRSPFTRGALVNAVFDRLSLLLEDSPVNAARRPMADFAVCLALLVVGACAPSVRAGRTLYVAPHGDDARAGLSPAKPLATLGRAAQLAKPGDTVIVAGGVYPESVILKTPGTVAQPIVFRAAAGETPVVTAGARPGNWRSAPGSRWTFVARWPRRPRYLWENRTVTRYMEAPDIPTVDQYPGAFHYDESSKTLYAHPLSGMSPREADIVAVAKLAPVSRNWFSHDRHANNKGFLLRAPYTRIEGFTFCYQYAGVFIWAPHCEVRGNTAYGCQAGIVIHADNARVVRNTCFRNDTHGIIQYGVKNAVVRGNFCYDNGPAGPLRLPYSPYGNAMNLAVYGRLPRDSRYVGNTVVSSDPNAVFRFKTLHGKVTVNGNVLVGGPGLVGWGEPGDFSNNTVIGGALRARDSFNTLIDAASAKRHGGVCRNALYLEKGLSRDDGFADPIRHDYRLRADSPHLGKGVHPRAAPLRYVSPRGDDKADGRTPARAWRTLSKAAASAAPGETVYVLPGTYPEVFEIALRAAADKPVAFKSHGRGRVLVTGDGKGGPAVTIRNASHVALDGFTFRRCAVRVEGGADVGLSHCVFDGSGPALAVKGAARVTLANNTFRGGSPGVELVACRERVVLRNNLFARCGPRPVAHDAASARLVVAEANAFTHDARSWLEGWERLVPPRHPALVIEPDLLAQDYQPTAPLKLAYRGVGHRAIGATAPKHTAPIRIERFRAASVLPDRALLAWRTPENPAEGVILWECSDGRNGALRVRQEENLREVSMAAVLAGLKPGQTYRITLTLTDGQRTGVARCAFDVPRSARPPKTLYVSPSGDDSGPGDSAERPLRTLAGASAAMAPGDTVLVLPSVYRERLLIWCGGRSAKQRLTFRSARPGAAVIDMSEIRSGAIRLLPIGAPQTAEDHRAKRNYVRRAGLRLKHVTIDGFRFRGLTGTGSIKVVLANDTDDLVFQNNVFEDSRASRGCSNLHLQLNDIHGALIRNNVFHASVQAIEDFFGGSDNVTIDHNTFYQGGTGAIYLNTTGDTRVRITNNIFVDVISRNKRNPAILICRPTKHLVCDHNLYFRERCPKMRLVGYRWPEKAREDMWTAETNPAAIEDLRRKFGLGQHSRFGDPMWGDPSRADFRLKPGSPAVGMGEGGSNVGADFSVFVRGPEK